ncbi:Lsr2 family protein [Terracoccus sp. 273MFTsu3.1]|uniref:histone-like nucleoid-structuring protein Lsr2 n=1 Tax=Terracoccus sp. 273MFTsu3.1 TaxID=1172188 RepID=UPI00036B9C54|nr:Lsr2 family protein [Terracoccus sp. 273MFTsu3.1]
MAQKIEVLLVDDIDGSDATETVTFGLDGKAYEIDLNDKNAKALRAALASFVGHARKAGSIRQASKSTSKPSGSKKSDGNAAAIREWAAKEGVTVGAKGRIPEDVRAQFEKATA